MRTQNLEDFFTDDQPFGPPISDAIEDNVVFKEIFRMENRIYKEFKKSRPSLILGRKGAGKTAFLRSVYIDGEHEIIVQLPPHKLFIQVIQYINEMATGTAFVEDIAEFWDVLLWAALMNELVIKYGKTKKEELSIVANYLDEMGITQEMSPHVIIHKIVEVCKQRAGTKAIGIMSDILEQVVLKDTKFELARTKALDFLDGRKINSIILLDAVEDFKIDNEKMAYAIGGLLRCQANFHKPGLPVEMRCCLPAELLYKIINFSSNPEKDFYKKVILHWHAGELLSLACHRYAIYLKLHYPKIFQKFGNLNLDKRSDAHTFWDTIFPTSVKNGLGFTERSRAYILRHTQLLPRQVIMILNEIAVKNKSLGGDVGQFLPEAVRDGIRNAEDTIIQQIFNAYKHIHPGARELCQQCIRHLPLHFTRGDLRRAFNAGGAKGIAKGVDGVYDFNDFERAFTEIGVVGKQIEQPTEKYNIAQFEYFVPNQLHFNEEDILCLHPLVCEIYGAMKPKDNGRVTYPYGSDVDMEDNRQLT